MKAITVNQLIADLQDTVKENHLYGNLPIIYSSDDEGNNYQKVHNNATLCQIEDLKQYSLELVGFRDSEGISEKDCNAVIIN